MYGGCMSGRGHLNAGKFSSHPECQHTNLSTPHWFRKKVDWGGCSKKELKLSCWAIQRNDCIVRYRNSDQTRGDICLKCTQTNGVSSGDDMTSMPSSYCSYKAVSNSKEDINLNKIRQYSSIPIVLQSFQYAPSIHRVIIFITNLS